MNILIVDDNPDDRRILRYLFEKRGHLAIEAENGIDGLQKARNHTPELIISDALMPLMDGFQFLRTIKQEAGLSLIPFIFYSSLYQEDKDIRLAMSLGADAYIIKPVDPIELWEKIDRILRASKKDKAPLLPLIQEDVEYLKRYSEVVATKLEEKVGELERILEEQRHTEQSLREMERKQRTLVENIPDGIARFDANCRHLFVNPAVTHTFGIPAETFLGKTLRELTASEDDLQNQELEERIKQVFEQGSTHSVEARWSTPEGIRYFDILHVPEKDDRGKVVSVLSIAHDITERKRAQEETRARELQLLRADKLASIGLLVSGVAHEINNPNNFLMLNAKILNKAWQEVLPVLDAHYLPRIDSKLAGLPYSEARRLLPELLQGMIDGTLRIKNIVESLRNYSKKDTSELKEDVDINKAVDSAIFLVANLIKNSTDHFITNLATPLPLIRGSEQQIEQVVINLLTNACQALENRSQRIEICTFSQENVVFFQVKDEGIGIEPHLLDQIMTPFYTTKRETGGTGLGLSICQNIVKNHYGHIEIQSQPGIGTRITIGLPTKR